MIHYSSPFDLSGNIGKAYNYEMSRLPNDDDWMCFTDADTCFLTSNYGRQLQIIVDMYPNTGMFTCLTNRVGQVRQCYEHKISDNPDIRFHRKIALELANTRPYEVEDLGIAISGHMMLIKKATWNANKFSEEGILGVDNKISRKLLMKGYKILLMRGVYIFHYYRFNEDVRQKTHLKILNNGNH